MILLCNLPCLCNKEPVTKHHTACTVTIYIASENTTCSSNYIIHVRNGSINVTDDWDYATDRLALHADAKYHGNVYLQINNDILVIITHYIWYHKGNH